MFERRILNIILAFAAVIFLVSLGYTSDAEALNIQGQITAVDRDAMTITIQPCGSFDKLSFAWTDKAIALVGNQIRSFDDLRVGDGIELSYHDVGNVNFVADGANIYPPYSNVERC